MTTPLTATLRRALFQEMTFVNGQKYFGKYDHLIPQEGWTNERCFVEHETPQVTLLIPVMERTERFVETCVRLWASLEYAAMSYDMVVLDMSLQPGLYPVVMEHLKAYRGQALGRLLYHYHPRLTFSSARTYAVQVLSRTSELIASWDADIYCSLQTWSELLTAWKQHPELCGIAPPLGFYRGGTIDAAIGSSAEALSQKGGQKAFHMPGKIGETIGSWNDTVLETGLMRGAFCLKRSLLNAVAASMPLGEPWSRDMIMWSNVPFFLCANELGARWGYLMRGQATVVHDDRADQVAMGTAFPTRMVETLKDIALLCYRNQVEDKASQRLHANFLAFNLPTITRVTGCSEEHAHRIQHLLLTIGACLRQATHPALFHEYSTISMTNLPESLQTLGRHIVSLLMHEDVFHRVKQLRSLDTTHPIYQVQARAVR